MLPDLDLVRFYLFDHRRIPHHAYWSHQPIWWALVWLALFGVAWLRVSSRCFAGNAHAER